jgi:hypothetical protein
MSFANSSTSQLKRFGELQAQLDQIHRLLKSIVSQP